MKFRTKRTKHQVTQSIILFICMMAVIISCEPKQKDILIIGDSISIGYFSVVKEALQQSAFIAHSPGNAQHTGTGMEKIDEWIGETEWDIIVFNWGLWDLCYRHPDSKLYGNRDKINGTITFSPEQYSDNLDSLALRLKKTKAKLIFVSTTYIPPGEGGRVEGDDIIYNNAARGVMKKRRIEYLDINLLSKEIHSNHSTAPGDVHLSKEGYMLLSEPIIERLKELI